ncbi:MAG TPA: hypothetical protein VN201_14085 [Roseateles sp.]|nr:hypothetical protein [Roseateles sp.]HWT55245.1 hypothetical protein [Rhodocyclaceae bacterium]
MSILQPRAIVGMLCAALPLIATAQSKPPLATYWMSAETTAGMNMTGGAPSMSDMASMMLGGGMGGSTSKRLLLQLGSQQSASGDPAADHFIPAAMNMGSSLPLRTPQKVERKPGRDEEDVPENYEKPKGRLLLFWGCGAQAGAGQPYVIDFAKVASGKQWPAGLFTRRVSGQIGPAYGRSKTYGDWPNEKDSTRVPNDASLRGEHTIKGNYSPDIKFNLENLDYLAPLDISMSKQAAGAMDLRWKSITNATGYFANVMGADAGGNDMVWWVSANSKEFGEVLFSYIPPAEVAKLVKDKVVLSPSTTECTVPKEVMAAAPNAMLRMIAYGDEANFAYPPRPKDPKAPWNPEWAAKVRVKSTAFQPIMEGQGGSRGSSGNGSEDSGAAVGKALKGLFGF